MPRTRLSCWRGYRIRRTSQSVATANTRNDVIDQSCANCSPTPELTWAWGGPGHEIEAQFVVPSLVAIGTPFIMLRHALLAAQVRCPAAIRAGPLRFSQLP